MTLLFSLRFTLLAAYTCRLVVARTPCDPSLACWPSPSEILDLYNALDPSIDRTGLFRQDPSKGGSPFPSAIPIYSPDDQALYGFVGGDSLPPLFVNNRTLDYACFARSTALHPEVRGEG